MSSMIHKHHQTIQGVLKWLEGKLNDTLYIKVYSDGSGQINNISNKNIVSFKSPDDLYKMIINLEKIQLKENS